MNDGAIERIERAYAAHFAERQSMLPGAGVSVRAITGAVLFTARTRPEVDWMNTALVMGRVTPPLLEEIVAFYRQQGVRPRIEAVAGEPEGFVSGGELFVMAVVPPADSPDSGKVAVRAVDADSFGRFADVYVEAFGRVDIPRPDVEGWSVLKNWKFYFAEVAGKPAGAGILSIHGDVGYLGSAATLPAMRGRGVHSALLHRRMADAASAGCSVIFGRAAPGGPGAAGLLRAGLMLSHRKKVWLEAR